MSRLALTLTGCFAQGVLILSFLTVASKPSLAQGSSPSDQISVADAAALAGCYQLQLGRWWPWGLGEDAVFATPPQRMELTLDRGTQGFETYGLVIRPLSTNERLRRSAFWRPLGRTHAVLTWTTGFSGVGMILAEHGGDLRGRAHAFFDFPRIPHKAHVVARKIPCNPT